MKRKIVVVICIILLICISSISNFLFSPQEKIVRYEQHIEAPKTQDSGSVANGDLVSHLPLISIETNEQKIPGQPVCNENDEVLYYEKGNNGEEEIKVEISIYDNEQAQNSIKNEENIKSNALFKIRGNTSRRFDKNSYKISFIDDQELPIQYEVMGMKKGDEWALYGPFLDKTLIRNYMWLNISAQIMGYAPNVRFCECYIDGRYNGLYIMMETIEKADERVNISTYDKDSRIVPYMVKMDRLDEDEIESLPTFTHYTFHLDYQAGFTILYPGATYLTQDVKKYIEKDISGFEKVLYSYDFKDPQKGYSKYIDVESWVDYYIIQEFLANNDMCSRSTYLYKDAGGKLTIGPVWDFNNVCDNYMSSAYYVEGFYFAQNRLWYEMLLKDEIFVRKVQKRYKELRETFLNKDYINRYIDDTIEYLGEAIQRNFEVWGYTFERQNQTSIVQYLTPIDRNPQSYEEAVEQYRQFIIQRGQWLDNNIQTLEQYCHKSRNKLYAK